MPQKISQRCFSQANFRTLVCLVTLFANSVRLLLTVKLFQVLMTSFNSSRCCSVICIVQIRDSFYVLMDLLQIWIILCLWAPFIAGRGCWVHHVSGQCKRVVNVCILLGSAWLCSCCPLQDVIKETGTQYLRIVLSHLYSILFLLHS